MILQWYKRREVHVHKSTNQKILGALCGEPVFIFNMAPQLSKTDGWSQ